MFNKIYNFFQPKNKSSINYLKETCMDIPMESDKCKRALNEIDKLKKSRKKSFKMDEYNGYIQLDILEELLNQIITANNEKDMPFNTYF